jgi:hypothetical protein
MTSPAGPFKVAQEAALRASAALATAMGGTVRLYTEVPANAPLPYIVIGQDDVSLEPAGDCATEAEITSTLTLWSRTSPLDKGVQARAIGSAVIGALNAELTITGWDVDLWELQGESYSTNADQSARGVVVLHYLLTEQVA